MSTLEAFLHWSSRYEWLSSEAEGREKLQRTLELLYPFFCEEERIADFIATKIDHIRGWLRYEPQDKDVVITSSAKSFIKTKGAYFLCAVTTPSQGVFFLTQSPKVLQRMSKVGPARFSGTVHAALLNNTYFLVDVSARAVR